MDIKLYIHQCLENLKELGIDALEQEQEIMDGIMSMPDELLDYMDESQIVGMLFFYIKSDKVYIFDAEVSDIENMYTIFLKEIEKLTEGDLQIDKIVEVLDDATLETGVGIHPFQFECNQKEYKCLATAEHDWFDVKVLDFMNEVIAKQQTGKSLYFCSDGGQECVIFYATEDWAHRFSEKMGISLEK